jgi:hypothetical protein
MVLSPCNSVAKMVSHEPFHSISDDIEDKINFYYQLLESYEGKDELHPYVESHLQELCDLLR